MNRITTATHRIAGAALRRSWAITSSAERLPRGVTAEAWAHRGAVRWRCLDDVLATITSETLSR